MVVPKVFASCKSLNARSETPYLFHKYHVHQLQWLAFPQIVFLPANRVIFLIPLPKKIRTSETKSFALKLTQFHHLFFSNALVLGECKIHLVVDCCKRKLFNKEEQMNWKRNLPLCSHNLESFDFFEIDVDTINTLFWVPSY